MLKQETDLYEFHYSALRPFIHYIPLSRDLEDLESQISWAQQHPTQAYRIATEAQQHMQKTFNMQATNQYLLELLTRYAQLLTFEPKLTPEFRPARLPFSSQKWMEDLIGGPCKHWDSWDHDE